MMQNTITEEYGLIRREFFLFLGSEEPEFESWGRWEEKIKKNVSHHFFLI